MPVEYPLLTIAIPTYNCAHFLPDAIRSVMRQGLDDFEIVIVDNASEDNTEEVVRSFEDAPVRYFRNPSNLGSRENGNRCMAHARGRYIKFLCADDVLLDGILRKQLSILESRPEVALVTCNNFITDDRLQIKGVYLALPGSHPGRRVMNLCLSRLSNCIGGPSNVMFRRSAAAGVVSDSSYRLVADLKCNLQLLEQGDYVNIGEPGYLYRRHENSDIATNCPTGIEIPEMLRLASEYKWWNPLNCLVALMAGGSDGKQFVRQHWRQACTPVRLASSIEASADVLYKRWNRFSLERQILPA